ncbi:MAG: hypothetical protein A2341_22565 [Deltaproteobacteria bacterium RIFOXYB12_FULL_58_9]|nr:MAG: hypothetical protein A2341_22565 [Deltaproteobacteria bacterium RIFOXYB12_FULL_58_9]
MLAKMSDKEDYVSDAGVGGWRSCHLRSLKELVAPKTSANDDSCAHQGGCAGIDICRGQETKYGK